MLERKELGQYLRYAIISFGGIWAWMLSRPTTSLLLVGLFMPLAVSTLLFIEAVFIRQKIFKIAGYIADIERRFNLPVGMGWENQLGSKAIKRDKVTIWETAFWILLCIANGALAVLLVRGILR